MIKKMILCVIAVFLTLEIYGMLSMVEPNGWAVFGVTIWAFFTSLCVSVTLAALYFGISYLKKMFGKKHR